MNSDIIVIIIEDNNHQLHYLFFLNYLVICSLFKGVANISDYIASNDKLISE
jgi:hypothetical protein